MGIGHLVSIVLLYFCVEVRFLFVLLASIGKDGHFNIWIKRRIVGVAGNSRVFVLGNGVQVELVTVLDEAVCANLLISWFFFGVAVLVLVC
jgi:hypothetical protein